MLESDCCFMVDVATIFYNYLRIEGWFYCPTDTLAEVKLSASLSHVETGLVNLPHAGVAGAYGPNKGFRIEAFLDDKKSLDEMGIVFLTQEKREINVRMIDLCEERKKAFEGRPIIHRFIEMVNSAKGLRLLDIGGRARSGIDRSELFPAATCTVLDVLASDNVDIVGDAHAMSKLFPPNSFDAIFSSSVFEHLLMPWIVAAEMARVLKPGGIAFIATHQTMGLHDRPWDFWRFSDAAWDGLFNRLTGFEILDRAMENPQFIIPHFWSPERGNQLEQAVGYVGSAVLVKKIGNPQVAWEPLLVSDIVPTSYPDTEEPSLA